MQYQELIEHFAAKGNSMPLEKTLHYITRILMDGPCPIITYNTVIYQAGVLLYEQLLEDPAWKERIGEGKTFYMAMSYFNDKFKPLENHRHTIDHPVCGSELDDCLEFNIDYYSQGIDMNHPATTPLEIEWEELLQALCVGAKLLLEKNLPADYWKDK